MTVHEPFEVLEKAVIKRIPSTKGETETVAAEGIAFG
jgi:hypothetical protein